MNTKIEKISLGIHKYGDVKNLRRFNIQVKIGSAEIYIYDSLLSRGMGVELIAPLSEKNFADITLEICTLLETTLDQICCMKLSDSGGAA